MEFSNIYAYLWSVKILISLNGYDVYHVTSYYIPRSHQVHTDLNKETTTSKSFYYKVFVYANVVR